MDTIIRRRAAATALGLSISRFHAAVVGGILPPLIKVGPRASGLLASEVACLVKARAAGLSEADMQTLTRRLVRARNQAGQELKSGSAVSVSN